MMEISREADSDGRRWYTRSGVSALSVTTILGIALEEDETGLEIWKKKNDGSGDNAHHEHLYWYSGPRGTLCHYQALKRFEEHFDGDEDMWGDEEMEAMRKVTEGPEEGTFEDASHDLEDITYSVLVNQDAVRSREQYEHLFKGSTRLVDVLHADLGYFVETFGRVCEELGIDSESVIRVEKYLLNEKDMYGGQCDLLYEDPQGNVVLADLKTSGSLRQKHRLQGVAYMKAVEKEPGLPEKVDRIEVIRIHPDSQTWQVHSHEVPEHVEHLAPEHYTDEHWFTDQWGEFDYDDLEDMWETFKQLTEDAHDSV